MQILEIIFLRKMIIYKKKKKVIVDASYEFQFPELLNIFVYFFSSQNLLLIRIYIYVSPEKLKKLVSWLTCQFYPKISEKLLTWGRLFIIRR